MLGKKEIRRRRQARPRHLPAIESNRSTPTYTSSNTLFKDTFNVTKAHLLSCHVCPSLRASTSQFMHLSPIDSPLTRLDHNVCLVTVPESTRSILPMQCHYESTTHQVHAESLSVYYVSKASHDIQDASLLHTVLLAYWPILVVA